MADSWTSQRSPYWLLKDSFDDASGDADETFCDPCKSEGKWLAVEGYCKICEEHLCENCLSVHRKQRITRGHVIVDKYQMTQTPRRQGSTYSSHSQCPCVEVCETHHPEIIRYYCKSHDEPGCGDCMTLNHASCKKDRVQDISEGFAAKEEYKEIQQRLNTFRNVLEDMKATLDANLCNMDTSYGTIQHKITSFRQEVNDYLDKIQEQITKEAEVMRKQHETEMKKLIEENNSMKSELEDILQRIQDDSDLDENSIFVITKQAKQRLRTMEGEIKIIEQSLQHQHYYGFRPSTEIANLLSTKTPLGKLLRKPNINTTASYRGDINVRTKADKKSCFILDCTLLSPDRLVITDSGNFCVKLVDLSDNTVESSYNTSTWPFGVSTMKTDRVAVTLPDEGKIEILNVTSSFKKHNDIRVSPGCSSITYTDEKFAVSYCSPNITEILDMQGQVLHTIQHDNVDVKELPFCISFGHDNDAVIVSNYDTRQVNAVTFDGRTLRSYAHDALKRPRGFVMTPDGVLFVCSWENDCLHAVPPDFKTSQIIITNDKHIARPLCIAYCDIKHRLYISNVKDHMDRTMTVYDLNV